MKISADTGAATGGGARLAFERKIVAEFRAWIHLPATLDAIFGPKKSYLQQANDVRSILGLAHWTKANIPPGEDWETVEPHRIVGSKEREAWRRHILGLPPEDEDLKKTAASQSPAPPT